MNPETQLSAAKTAKPPGKLQANGTLYADKTYIVRNNQGGLMAAGDTAEECYRQAFMFDAEDGMAEIAEYRLVGIRRVRIGLIQDKEAHSGETQG